MCLSQLWDVPGNERFRRPGGLTGVYYKHSHGAMVTTDLARRQTFLTARAWIEDFLGAPDIVDYWGEEGQPAPILLVGNKSDLQNVTFNREEYNLFVEEQNLLGFFEVFGPFLIRCNHPNLTSLLLRLLTCLAVWIKY